MSDPSINPVSGHRQQPKAARSIRRPRLFMYGIPEGGQHRMTAKDTPLFSTNVTSSAILKLTHRQRLALGEWVRRGMTLVASGLYAAANIHWLNPEEARKTGVPVVPWVEPIYQPRPSTPTQLAAHTLRLPGNRVVFHKDGGDACIILSQLNYHTPKAQSSGFNQLGRHIAHNRAYSSLEEALHTLQLANGSYLSRAFSRIPFNIDETRIVEADIAETMLDQGCPVPQNFLSPENGYNRDVLVTHKPPYPVTPYALIYEAHWPWVEATKAQLSEMPLHTPQTLGRSGDIQVHCPPGFLPQAPVAILEKTAKDKYKLQSLSLKGPTGLQCAVQVLKKSDVGNGKAVLKTLHADNPVIELEPGDWVGLNKAILFEVPPAEGFTYMGTYDNKLACSQLIRPNVPSLIDTDHTLRLSNNLSLNLMAMAQMEQPYHTALRHKHRRQRRD